ncbi:MAG: hypothetical protein JJE25_06455 [Bacteroidia bacterium]|nr:hypothetical protein [Bacteroidia bacterium]
MKLKVMFIITTVYAMLVGLPAIFAPEQLAAMVNLQVPPSLLMDIRFLGVAELGLGIIAWLIRNAEASKTLSNAALGFAIYFSLHALTSLYGQLTDTTVSMHWVMATLQGLIAIGFFSAGKAKPVSAS